MRAGAILLAAGQGVRLGGPKPKALARLAGSPLFLHSMRTFLSVREIVEVALVTPKGFEKAFARAADRGLENLRGRLIKIVPGGARRQDSVDAGLGAISEECPYVLVHDTARPLVDAKTIRAVLQGAAARGACICAAEVSDTIKRVEGNRVKETLDRSSLRRAQTPQGFKTGLLRHTFALARRRGWEATDCAGLVEREGRPIAVVLSTGPNPKVTTKEDLAAVETLLKRRRK